MKTHSEEVTVGGWDKGRGEKSEQTQKEVKGENVVSSPLFEIPKNFRGRTFLKCTQLMVVILGFKLAGSYI